MLRTAARYSYHEPDQLPARNELKSNATIRPILVSLVLMRAIGLAGCAMPALGENRSDPFCIRVVDKENGWPVPMVELRTTHEVRFVSDNAGRIAVDLPELMGRETWFAISSDGYEVPVDGFGQRGVRLTPGRDDTVTVEVNRTSIAKRLGRITGAGLFGESQKLGLETDWGESGVFGCDSVLNALHNGRMFWAWGDTFIAGYSLGIFDATSATTAIRPLERFEPPLRLKLNYFLDKGGRPRGVAKMPGKGPTWLSGYASLPDKSGKQRLVATYTKITPPLEAYEYGLCVWNDETANFEHLRTLWKKTEGPRKPPLPLGHPVVVDGEQGQKWVLFCDALPKLRCPATFEAWQDPDTWEVLKSQTSIPTAAAGKSIVPGAGSIAWNAFRKRWVTIFVEMLGPPSAFGEIWYAEADSPFGPWGPAVKVLSHANYSLYGPRLHPEFTPADSPILLFEGTHSTTFANHPEPTPRYEYNQLLYRLDLDDAKLARARESSSAAAKTRREAVGTADGRG
jgi:hypothetical protein